MEDAKGFCYGVCSDAMMGESIAEVGCRGELCSPATLRKMPAGRCVRRAGDRRSPLQVQGKVACWCKPRSIPPSAASGCHLPLHKGGLCCFPHNSALSFSQQKLSELCASLELQAAASATGGAAFRSVAARPNEMGRRPRAVPPARRPRSSAIPAWVSKGPNGPSWGAGAKPLPGSPRAAPLGRGVQRGQRPLWLHDYTRKGGEGGGCCWRRQARGLTPTMREKARTKAE